MNETEHVAREIMGWVGSKPLTGDYPWDAGVMPETATQGADGKPVGGEGDTFFFTHEDCLAVFGPKNHRGSRGPAFFFNPFTKASSAQMVLEKLGKPNLLFDALRQILQQRG